MDLETMVTVKQTAWASYRRLLGYVAKYWVVFAIAIIGFALFAASQAAFVELTKYMVEGVEQNDVEARYIVPLLVLLVFLVRGIGFFLGNYGMAYVARHVVHDLRVAIFEQLLVLPAAYYHHHASGTLLSKLIFNVEQITGAATDALKILVREGLTIVGLFAYLLYLNWQLTMAFLLVGPFIGLVVNRASKRFRTISGNLQDSMGDVTASASESIKGYDVVRMFGGQARERQRFFKASNGNRQQAMKLALAESVATPVVQMLVAMAMALLIFLALQPEIIAIMSAGEFIAFIIAAGMLTKPLRSLTEVNSILQQGIAASQSIFALLDEAPEPDMSDKKVLQAKGDITFHQLGFAYQDKPILEDIDLTLPAGKVVALVGRSGSGKSTLVNLLLRFYDPQTGYISIGGQDISQVARASLREQIALVNQQVMLFNGTIAENIAYGAMADASVEAIEAAAKAARVDEFTARMEQGLHTRIGEAGVLLSGGQRQRIALARALLKDAPILVLDEATSALDTESERHIQSAVNAAMTGRTTLVIAHRLSTIEQADIIVVMDQGKIVEQGSHQALLQQQGLYAHLHSLQFAEQSEV
ncbi:MAG: lipid A export permease/ATP-binding protein MsbA [Gammaproteobacteria bacterium]|jgi:subfamily B ATP-binding cassette protein MsbA|nr:lipid A export permease/ATP-binding protein MsbA [Gammaproteobacteria bacterium]